MANNETKDGGLTDGLTKLAEFENLNDRRNYHAIVIITDN
jgi:hypothetical protein